MQFTNSRNNSYSSERSINLTNKKNSKKKSIELLFKWSIKINRNYLRTDYHHYNGNNIIIRVTSYTLIPNISPMVGYTAISFAQKKFSLVDGDFNLQGEINHIGIFYAVKHPIIIRIP